MKFFRPVLALFLSIAAFTRPASNEPKPSRIWITDVTIVSPENLADLRQGQRANRERTYCAC